MQIIQLCNISYNIVLLFKVAYAIGVAKPVSLYIDTYGTGARSDAELLDIVEKNFDLRPGKIIE